ncbi:uncharacterized protein LOC62_02G002674 [Vanrija pseudolonga]|uniref:Tautomerase cis-CaaD-like domain-containing protein n=1 Tax=Vanrija pseudolonga TaxID=143232 RepID=A0AAF1BG39_9TREE|nr:hypothetical protein LOC62_02G002674 [Vanrija pseudolonga]
MPTYVVRIPAGLLNDAKKDALAQAITEAHHKSTGAPHLFAQVVIDEDSPTRKRYIGGKPQLTAEPGGHVWIRGDIRGGRSAELREDLLRRLAKAAQEITGVSIDNVWVYLSTMEPSTIFEFGDVVPVPDPAKEAAFVAGLAPDVRAKFPNGK